jgi:hypothetical protein
MLESRLVDLAFGELTADEKLRLLSEVESCTDCLCEYHSMTETLSVFDQSVAASLPEESYWPEHQAARRQRLDRFAPRAGTAKRESLWKRIFAARLRVPVPIAVAIALALLASSVLALRPSTREAATVIQPPVVLASPPKIVEVPVYHEKVVTRTVYVEKKMSEKNQARRPAPAVQPAEARQMARRDEEESGQGGFFTRANLTDFQPPDEMRIRVIKRSNSDEN